MSQVCVVLQAPVAISTVLSKLVQTLGYSILPFNTVSPSLYLPVHLLGLQILLPGPAMSLSRILNDDLVPRGHTPYVGPSHSTTGDAPRSPSVPLASAGYSYSLQHRSRDPQFSRTYNHPVGTLHHAPTHQDSGDWTREGIYRRSAESHPHSGKEYEYDRGLSDVSRHFRIQGEDPEDTMRKRYRGANEDSDYRLSGRRKVDILLSGISFCLIEQI